ncbi:RNA polymerase sigma-70 factor [Chitinophaga sp. 30R24]|uniref:RNA polymerase sigma-70 factor n=1 Tax=Chitinophaga sp. 30R24 TaxID=3248838 RepID=UPI003B8EF4BF
MMYVAYHNYSDVLLLQLLKQDNKEAFTVIYNRYWEKLLVYVMNAVKVQSEAEDIVQELFVSLWKRRKELSIQASLSTYLYNSAHYMCIRYIEKNITRSNYLEYLASFMAQDITSTIDRKLIGKEVAMHMETAISRLPDRMQRIFRLSREYNLSYQEIARQLNISEETVRKQIHRALKVLRVYLKDISLSVLGLLLIR